MSSKGKTNKKKSVKKTVKENVLDNKVVNTTTSDTGEYDGYRYLGIDTKLVKKNIFVGNKCLTLENGYRYPGIIKNLTEDENYIYVDFSETGTAKSHFENVSNQKIDIKDLAYLVCEKGDYYDINAEFVPPF